MIGALAWLYVCGLGMYRIAGIGHPEDGWAYAMCWPVTFPAFLISSAFKSIAD